MANNLKKIKGLTASRELTDRVGVAMFMYARNFDMSVEDSPEKLLAQWALGNPMIADSTMLALVATDSAIIDATTIVEPSVTDTNKGGNSATSNPNYVLSEVSLDSVSDEVITDAVEANWSRVAARFVVPTNSVTEPVSVTPGDQGFNPFLSASEPAPSTSVKEDDARPTKKVI